MSLCSMKFAVEITLKVENASEAMSNVDTSTYWKKLKNSSDCSIIFAKASYRAHSRSIVPQLSAISWCSYPDINVKRISGFVQIYSTVGERVPICLLSTLLNTWATSFLPSKSMRLRFWMRRRRRLLLYNSCASCDTTMSVWGSVSDVP